MPFRLGNKSKAEIVGVEPRLAYCAYMSIIDPSRTVDVSLFDGVRSEREQAIYRQRGTSWVDVSRHQLGQAVDLVPYVEGRNRWDANTIRDRDERKRIQAVIDTCYEENDRLMHKYAKQCGIELVQFPSDRPHYQLKDGMGWDIRTIKHNLDE